MLSWMIIVTFNWVIDGSLIKKSKEGHYADKQH